MEPQLYSAFVLLLCGIQFIKCTQSSTTKDALSTPHNTAAISTISQLPPSAPDNSTTSIITAPNKNTFFTETLNRSTTVVSEAPNSNIISTTKAPDDNTTSVSDASNSITTTKSPDVNKTSVSEAPNNNALSASSAAPENASSASSVTTRASMLSAGKTIGFTMSVDNSPSTLAANETFNPGVIGSTTIQQTSESNISSPAGNTTDSLLPSVNPTVNVSAYKTTMNRTSTFPVPSFFAIILLALSVQRF